MSNKYVSIGNQCSVAPVVREEHLLVPIKLFAVVQIDFKLILAKTN